MAEPLRCTGDDCDRPAYEALRLRDQPGHIHPCGPEAMLIREWCDVVDSALVVDGKCPWPCTVAPIAYGQPQAL